MRSVVIEWIQLGQWTGDNQEENEMKTNRSECNHFTKKTEESRKEFEKSESMSEGHLHYFC